MRSYRVAIRCAGKRRTLIGHSLSDRAVNKIEKTVNPGLNVFQNSMEPLIDRDILKGDEDIGSVEAQKVID